MRVLLLILVSSILIGESCAGLIFHNIRDASLLPKFYDHIVGRRNANYDNSPIVNIHNYQEVEQQEPPLSSYAQDYNQQQQMYGFQPSEHRGGHRRGDYGTLSNYGQHLYGAHHGGEGGFVNTNIKGAGLKYAHHGHNGGFGPTQNTMQQESYHHRYGSKFGQHHDPNIYGNTQIESSASAGSSLAGTSSASATSSSSSSGSSSESYFNDRVKPWLY